MENLIKAIKEDKSTAVLITELIEDFTEMCPYEIEEALRDIRDSAEIDAWMMKVYRKKLKE